MSELISGKDALIALVNGEDVEYMSINGWSDVKHLHAYEFLGAGYGFRLKPRTITINGVEVPAPDRIETNPNLYGGWAINIGSEYYMYKSESNYNIVIAALRSVFGKK